MVKDRRKHPTAPTRQEHSRRRRASIRNEEAYIRNTKVSLGDDQALRAHALRHERGAANPCTLKTCHELIKLVLLDLLKRYELAIPVAPDLRELRAAITELVVGAERCVTILDRLIPRVSDRDVAQTARDYFDGQRESNEKIKSLLFASATSDPLVEVLAERPLHHYREFATMMLGVAGYSYQEIAKLVDEGDSDRTRKSLAWRSALDEYKRQGKRPPKKRRVQPDQGGQPHVASMASPATPPVATAARAEVTPATKRRPAAGRAATPKWWASEGRVEQVKHLIDEPVLDQELDSGPRNV